MPLFNVTPTSFDHICMHVDPMNGQVCGLYAQQPRPHDAVELVQIPESNKVIMVITCPAGHRECFNMNLDVGHESGAQYSEEHRQQAQQIRQLQKHLGLPVK